MASISTRTSGDLGERYAIWLLRKNGYRIIDRNFHSRFGEIDIVAIKDSVLVYVEVKTRWSRKYGLPEEAVTPRKLKRIIKTGDYYRSTHEGLPRKTRVDVIAITVAKNSVARAKIIRAV